MKPRRMGARSILRIAQLEITFCTLVAACGSRSPLDVDEPREADSSVDATSDRSLADQDAAIWDAPADVPADTRVCEWGACGADADPELCPFDRGAAAYALGAVTLKVCLDPNGPTGSGHVKVTFIPNGTVGMADVDAPPFLGTPVGACIAQQYLKAKIPAFCGDPVTVGKSFSLP